MHEGTKRLLFLGGLLAAWLLPGLAILAVLLGRLRPSYQDGWRMRLTSATGMHAEFPALEHPLPRTVRLPRITFRDPLRDDIQADCESLVVRHAASHEWSVRTETVLLSTLAIRAWADRLAAELTLPRHDPAASWRISADRIVVSRRDEVLWRGASFLGWTAVQDGLPVFRATWRAAEDDSRLPPISLQIGVRRGNIGGTIGGLERTAMLDTGGRYLPLELCRAVLGRNPRVELDAQADFKGRILVRGTQDSPPGTPFAPDPILDETIVSGELRCDWGPDSGVPDRRPRSERPENDSPAVIRVSMDRLRLQNGRAVDGKATLLEARGASPDILERLF